MDKELTDFKIEVLTKLAVIDSKLDGYQEIKKTASDADNRSKQNEINIKDIEDKIKWISRTTTGALIMGGVGLVFILIKIGLGIN